MSRRRPGLLPSLRTVVGPLFQAALRRLAGRAGLLAPAVLAALSGIVAPALAETSGAVPTRRVVAEAGTDFYGGDIRSIYGTSLELCRNICLDTADCGAFTFNLKANACFLKSGVTQRAPFANALSAMVVATDPGTLAVAAARARDLAFLPAMYLDAARAAALDGPAYPASGADAQGLADRATVALADGNPLAAMAALQALAILTDDPSDWLAVGAVAGTLRSDDYEVQNRARTLAVAAAANAYLRAPEAGLQARAAQQLAIALEAAGYGRPALSAVRLAASLAPDAGLAPEVTRLQGLYGFRLIDRQVDSESLTPRACFEFSEPLAAGGVDYADFVRVEGGTFPVESEERRICIEGLSHGSRYGVTLRAGLPSAAGESLPASVGQEVYVRDRTPAVRFLGRAYVLPKGPDAAIPVSSVNAATLDLKIFRVGQRNVSGVIRDGEFGRALTGYGEARLGDQTGVEVWAGTGTVAPDLNRDVVTALPLGPAVAGLDPGLYALTARVAGAPEDDGGTVPTQWFVITDLGVATLKGADGLHVFLRALGTAAPREGVEVRLLARNNEVLGSATTDAEGHVRFDPGLLRGKGGAEAALVTAETPEDFVFLDLGEPGFDLSDRGVEGRPAPPPVDVFLATDRGAYRPGESVHATILARTTEVAAIDGLPLTAIVSRPDGVEHARLTLPDQGAGGRTLDLALDPDATRGGWKLAIHADPKAPPLATAGFLVEDFVPERVKLDLSLPEGPVDPATGAELQVRADYLYGAPGADLALEGEVTLGLARSLPDFPGYVFGREDEPFQSGYQALPAGLVTGPDGTARIALDLPPLGPVSRPVEMTATLRASDGSGRPVERSLTRPVLPDAPLVGVKPLFDGAVDEGGTASLELIALDPRLAATDLGPLDWTLSRVDTSYLWYEINGTWTYEPVTRRERVASGSVSLTAAAPVRLDLPVNWGRYEFEIAATAAAAQGRYIATSLGFSAGWYAAGGAPDTPDRLDVSLDRAAYATGDTARLRIAARNPGQVLVAVMTDRLVASRSLTVAEGETVVDLPVTADWGPGAYVAATLVRPMDIPARRNPARAIGLAWAAVDPGPRQLAAAFEVPDEASPRATLPAVLKIDGLAPGETAFATIAAVDVGILNLTGYTAPDPDGHYFGQRRLGMEIRDVYGRLIDGMQGTPGQVRSGGDSGGSFRAPPPTEDLVAVFSGPLTADADGRVTAPVPVPDFNGTVRLMAVVWSDRAVGQAAKDVLVRDPVVMQASLPRFLAPGDRSRLRIDLAHAFGPDGRVETRVAATPPGLVPEGAAVAGDLAASGRLVGTVPLTAGAGGDDRLTLTTTTPGGETLDADLTLPVRANDPVLARQSRVELAPGATLTLDATVFDGLSPGTASATLAAGPLAEFDVPGLLSALDLYPFGCTEQLVSKAMPLLYFGAMAGMLDQPGAGDIDERIAAAIRGVLANQTGTGSFGLWQPGGGEPWLDAYATDFLSRARALGHPVPDRAYEAALTNLGNLVNAYGDFETGGEDLAYALMVLAREGRASIGDLRYYADTRAEAFATPFAQAQLGLALAWYGDQPRADAMFRLASAGAAAGEPEQVWRADYGSGLRDAAGVLTMAAEARSGAVDTAGLVGIVTAPGAVRSTQESLWTLLAAHALLDGTAESGLTVDGEPAVGPVVRVLDPAALAAAPLQIANTAATPTTIVVTAFGVPTQPEPAQGNGYRVTRAYYTLDGQPADPAAVALNTRLVATVTVTPERDLQARLMVTDPLPAGLEIDNPNLLRAGQTGQLAWLAADDVASHTEFGADRFLAAVDWQGTKPFRLAYMVRAVSPGEFHHPAASVEDMYRPAYRARSDAGRVVVTDAP
jgi:uncharacterized protein YfaS (alpha-2-macroglobulin family)